MSAAEPAGQESSTGRVIIADDHGLFRQGLRQLLETEGYTVEAEAMSGEEALTAVAEHQGCVLLLDIAMPGMDGLEVARRLAERGDDVKVVMLSAREDRDALFSAIAAGARGYVAKDVEPDQLFAAIELVLRGGTVLSTGVALNLGEGIRQLDYAPGAYEWSRMRAHSPRFASGPCSTCCRVQSRHRIECAQSPRGAHRARRVRPRHSAARIVLRRGFGAAASPHAAAPSLILFLSQRQSRQAATCDADAAGRPPHQAHACRVARERRIVAEEGRRL